MLNQPTNTQRLLRATAKTLALVLPIVTISVVTNADEIYETDTVRTRRTRSNQLVSQQQSGATRLLPQPVARDAVGNAAYRPLVGNVPDDSAPYLKTTTQANAGIQLVGYRNSRTRKNQKTKTANRSSSPNVVGGLFGRLLGKKATTAGTRKPITSDDGAVYVPYNHQPALNQHIRELNQPVAAPVPQRVSQEADFEIVEEEISVSTVQQQAVINRTPVKTVPAPPAAPRTVSVGVTRSVPPAVQSVESSGNAITSSRAAAPQIAPPVARPPAAVAATETEMVPVRPRSAAVIRHSLDFPNPFEDVSERQADQPLIRQPGVEQSVVEQPLSPDFEIIEDEDDVKMEAPESKYEMDPSLSPYTGVTLGDKPFEVNSRKPRPFPGVRNKRVTRTNAMNKGQMTQLVSSRPDTAGLKGFCPVTLIDGRRLVDADLQFKARFGLKTYNFASAEAKRSFERNPTRYLPVAGGFDVVRLSATNEEVGGKLDHAAWYRGRLYLFESADTRRIFFENPTKFVDLF